MSVKYFSYGLLSIVLMSIISEATVRLFLMIPLSHRVFSWEHDSLWYYEWLKRYKKKDHGFEYSFDTYDPIKGWTSRPNLRNMQVFNNKVLNTNSLGLRGTKNVTCPKEKFRILIVGDSFTFGDEVSDSETYPYFLQQLMPNAEIINMGVHGYGHDQMLIMLKELGETLQPDAIVVGFISGDMPRNMLGFRSFAKPRYIFKNNNLEVTGTPIPTPQEIYSASWYQLRLVDLVLNLYWRAKEFFNYSNSDNSRQKITTALLKEIITFTVDLKAIPILAYIPEPFEIKKPNEKGQRYFNNFCKQNPQAFCFSTFPYFSLTNANQKKVHWNAKGNETIAKALSNFLKAKLSFPHL